MLSQLVNSKAPADRVYQLLGHQVRHGGLTWDALFDRFQVCAAARSRVCWRLGDHG